MVLQKLTQLFNEDTQNFEELGALLKQERAAIEKNQLSQLKELTCGKEKIFSELETHHQLRLQLLQELGYTTKDRLADFLQKFPQQPQLLSTWQNWQAQLQNVLSQHRINEQLVLACLSLVNQNLALMQGEDAAPTGELYTAKGKTKINPRIKTALEA